MAAEKELSVLLTLKDELSKNIDSAAKKISNIGVQATKVGAALTAISAAPTAAVVAATKAAIDWESAFTGVRKTVDASEEEFGLLESSIRSMSKQMPITANDLAGIMEIAGQLGVRGVDELTKFTDTIAKISETTNLTSEEAATDFAQIANIMKEPMKNVDRMGAVVVNLGNNFATTERDIVNFSSRIAGAGKIAGLSTDQIFAISTAFSSVGIEAEAGGTAVQKVLMAMTQAAQGSTGGIIDNTKAIANNSAKLNDLQAKLAIAKQKQSEFTEKTKESTKMANQAQIDKYSAQIAALTGELDVLNATNGQAKVSTESFAKVLGMTNKEYSQLFNEHPEQAFAMFVEELEKAGPGAFEILDDLDLKDQRLIRGFESLAQNSQLLTDALDMGNQAWQDNSALAEEAAKRFETAESKIEIAKNTFNDLGITIGTNLKDAFGDALAGLAPMLEKLNDWAKNNPKLVETLSLMTVAITAVGTSLVVLGGIAQAVSVLMNSALWPITLPILAITAIVVLLYEAWKNNWGGIQEITANVVEGITSIMQAAWAWLQELPGKFLQMWESIKTWASELPGRVAEWCANLWESIVTWLSELPGKIGEWLVILWESISVWAAGLWEAIVTWLNALPEQIGFALGFALGKIIQWGVDTWNYLVVKVPEIIMAVVQFFAELPGKLWTWLKVAWDKIKTWCINVWETMTTKVDEIITAVIQFFSEMPGKIWEWLLDAWNRVKEWAANLINTAKTEIPKFVETAINYFKELPEKIVQVGVDAVKGLWNGIKSMAGWLGDQIKGFVKGVIDGFKAGFDIHSPSKVFAEMGKMNIEGLNQGMKNAIDRLQLPQLALAISSNLDDYLNVYRPEPIYYNNARAGVAEGGNTYTDSHNSSIVIENVEMTSELDVESVAQYLGAQVALAVY